MNDEASNPPPQAETARNNVNQQALFRNNLLPGPGAMQVANLNGANLEALGRMMQREYERLNDAQKRIVKRLIVMPASALMAVVGAINIYNNQKEQTDKNEANVNTGLWSIAFLPLVAVVADVIRNAIKNRGNEQEQRQDDETESLSLPSDGGLDNDVQGMEMGTLPNRLQSLAAIPEVPENNMVRSNSQQSVGPSNRRTPSRSRSFP